MSNSKPSERRVEPFPDPPGEPGELLLRTYEYHHPFNYPNVEVERRYLRTGEFHGLEMNPVSSVGERAEHLPPDAIVIRHEAPIVRVAVIGSACQPPGYVQVEAEPLDSFYRDNHVPGTTAARFRVGNLWGMHLRVDQWFAKADAPIRDKNGEPYPEKPPFRPGESPPPNASSHRVKAHYREHPLVGMSSAVFEIPHSHRVTITGGSEVYGWQEDNYPDDVHYSFRMVRITVDASGAEH